MLNFHIVNCIVFSLFLLILYINYSSMNYFKAKYLVICIFLKKHKL